MKAVDWVVIGLALGAMALGLAAVVAGWVRLKRETE